MCFSNRGLTQLDESYTRRSDTGVNEGADAAELDAASVARKNTTNKGRASEELAKSAATLPLPSNMLPMLRLLNKKRWLLLKRLPSQQCKGRARI